MAGTEPCELEDVLAILIPDILDEILDPGEEICSVDPLELALRLQKKNMPKQIDDTLTYEILCRTLSGSIPFDGNQLVQYGKNIDYFLRQDPSEARLSRLIEIDPSILGWNMDLHGEKIGALFDKDPTGGKLAELRELSPFLITLGKLEYKDIKEITEHTNSLTNIREKHPDKYKFLTSILRKLFDCSIGKGKIENNRTKIDSIRNFYLKLLENNIREEIAECSSIFSYRRVGIISLFIVYANALDHGDFKTEKLSGKEIKDYNLYSLVGCAIDRLNSRWLHEKATYFESGASFWRELRGHWLEPGFSTSYSETEERPVWEILKESYCWATEKNADKRKNRPWALEFAGYIWEFANTIEIEDIPRYIYTTGEIQRQLQ